MDLIDQARYRNRWRAVVNAAMNLRVLLSVGTNLNVRGTRSFTRSTLRHGVGELVKWKFNVTFIIYRNIFIVCF